MTSSDSDFELAALRRLGLKDRFLGQCDIERLARVLVEQRGRYHVQTAVQRLAAQLPGRFRHQAVDPLAYPVVGDWVVLSREGAATIERVLDRTSLFARRSAGAGNRPQAIAANVDVVFVVSAASASDDPRVRQRGVNPRRIERYLVAVRQSGATPVLVVNKSDLARDRDAIAESLYPVRRDAAVVLVSAVTGEGMDALREHYAASDTVALVGSSGVGKSALVARLLGAGLERTGEARQDDERGRHTTSARELFVLPDGGALIDTPGMRELGLWWEAADVDDAFDEVGELARACRFRDCRHAGEPGCAVLRALDTGELDAERLESRNKLEREIAFERKKLDPRARHDAKRALVRRARAWRKHAPRDD